MKSTTNKPIRHDESIIEAHEDILNNLLLQGAQRNERLTNLEIQVKNNNKEYKEDNILISDTLGIKLKDNGERKKQIRHALDRISKIETREEYKEHKEETIFAMVYEIRDKVSKFEGYIEGLNDGEGKADNKVIHHENSKNLLFNKWQTWTGILLILIGMITIIFMVMIK